MRLKGRPIFLVSPTPASGLTQAQRTLTAHDSVHIWGDWGDTGLSIAALARFHQEYGDFQAGFEPRTKTLHKAMREGTNIADDWIAELSPEVEAVNTNLKTFIEKTCKVSPFWGFCSHFTAAHLPLMFQLFPDAFVIASIREPGEAFRGWTRYNGDEPRAKRLVMQARQAYTLLWQMDRLHDGSVLWVDQTEIEDTKAYIKKLYAPFNITATPFCRRVAEHAIEKHFHDPEPNTPEWLISYAREQLTTIYGIARDRAYAQLPRKLSGGETDGRSEKS